MVVATLQYCKVISLQLIKINEKKKKEWWLPGAWQNGSEELFNGLSFSLGR